jgi:hypothetical protein
VLVGKKVPTIVYDEIVSRSCRSPILSHVGLIPSPGLLPQALTTNYYAHNVSAIEEAWLSDIPGLSDTSIQSVKQSFEAKADVVME